MKKVISVILSLAMLLATSSVAFATDVSSTANRAVPIISSAESRIPRVSSTLLTEKKIRDVYWASSEFQAHYADNPSDALATLDKAVAEYQAPLFANTRATTDEEVASVSTSLVQQLNSYTCGPASSYMAIGGWNGTGSITGSTTTAKLERLATQMESASGVGTYVYKVRDVLNTYTSNHDYAYYKGSTLDQYLFRVYTFKSLSYDRAPILHAKTAALSYYNGHNTDTTLLQLSLTTTLWKFVCTIHATTTRIMGSIRFHMKKHIALFLTTLTATIFAIGRKYSICYNMIVFYIASPPFVRGGIR